jgi:hypothetical protein
MRDYLFFGLGVFVTVAVGWWLSTKDLSKEIAMIRQMLFNRDAKLEPVYDKDCKISSVAVLAVGEAHGSGDAKGVSQ